MLLFANPECQPVGWAHISTSARDISLDFIVVDLTTGTQSTRNGVHNIDDFAVSAPFLTLPVSCNDYFGKVIVLLRYAVFDKFLVLENVHFFVFFSGIS